MLKREKYAWLLCVFCLFVVVSVVQASNYEYFDVTFDDVTIPEPPGYAATPEAAAVAGVTSIYPTYVRTASGETADVYPQFTDSVTSVTMGGSGDQVVVMDDARTDSNVYMWFQNAASEAVTTGSMQIAFDLMYDTTMATSTTNNTLTMTLWNQDKSDKLGVFVIYQDTGEVYAYGDIDGSLSKYQIAGTDTSNPGEILHLSILFDMDASESWFYLNDVLLANDTVTDGTYTTDMSADAGNYGLLAISTVSTGTCKLGLDNVIIQSIPEPMTLGLVAFGGLFVIRRRK